MNTTAREPRPTNADVAGQLERVAELLEPEEENLFRVRSYRRAARELRDLGRPVAELLDEGGEERLRRIPGAGERLAGAIAEIVETGHLRLLDRLETEQAPEEAFERLPGIGEELAHRIHDELGVETLEALEHAAYTGRLGAPRALLEHAPRTSAGTDPRLGRDLLAEGRDPRSVHRRDRVVGRAGREPGRARP